MKWIAVAVASWVAAAVVFGGGLWYFIANIGENSRPLRAPGNLDFSVPDESGGDSTVSIWHDYETVYEGTQYSDAKAVPGLHVAVRGADGDIYEMKPSRGSVNESVGAVKRTRIGEFSLPPGSYTLEAAGSENPVILSVRVGDGMFWTISVPVVGVAISSLLCLLGLIFLIVGIVKIAARRKREQA